MTMNTQAIRRMLDRLRADPHVQSMIAHDAFTAAAVSTKVIDLNCRSQARRHEVAAQWCEAMAEGRWRRRIVERERRAVLDQVHFEFEDVSDQEAFAEWREAKGW